MSLKILAVAVWLSVGGLVANAPVQAGDLKDVVIDLYGGDGILLATPPMGFSHAPHFVAQSLEGLSNLNSGLTSSLGFLSFNSVVAGFIFDMETGEPVPVTDSFGPLLAERATTLGQGKLNVGFNYTQIKFTRYEGDQLNDLTLLFEHGDANGDGIRGPAPGPFDFELDNVRVNIDLELEQEIVALFATYGVTSKWDVGVIVPFIHMRARARATAMVEDNSPTNDVHFFDAGAPSGDPPTDMITSSTGGSATGIGDIVLRTKYQLMESGAQAPDLAIGAQIVLPTGDEDNLLGTGEGRVQLILIVSKSFGKITPHANVGYELTTGEAELDNLRYILGFDVGITQRVTAAVDLLGRWEPGGDGVGDDVRDIAFGTKIEIFENTLITANVQLPLNRNQGLRANVIWTLGAEKTF